ncbi:hypothetical protein JOC78_001629 [Bacillus ectoiniformans]|uniref:hypothetical protein n=1 Tax=Bacillus ectoiniformans TaxID=1494429 RepID=UPI001958007C|nr:hypothetical protein [Bacillus ectoiniformans]MBM7648683.1 hypothetical protein [Bacillus ectoiniformans]
MHLAYGVTGFYSSGDNPPPRNAGNLFKEMCYSAARKIKGDVIVYNKPQLHTNFFEAVIDNGSKRLHILLNAHYPLVAFASSVETGHITFYDEPALAEEFKGFYVCEARELNQLLQVKRTPDFTISHQHDLNTAELSQIMHWEPNTIGEIVFNFWD